VPISQELHDEFEAHVINSCLCPKVMTYFSTGVAEECAKFLDVINSILKENTKLVNENCGQKLDHNLRNLVLSEAGDIMGTCMHSHLLYVVDTTFWQVKITMKTVLHLSP